MNDISKLKKQITLYGSLVALVCEIVSFFILGWNPGFLIGLLAGLAAGILNFFILAAFLQLMLDTSNAAVSTGGFFVRMLIYCVAFFFCIRYSIPAGVGCLLGIMAPKVPMYYFYAIKSKFNKERKVPPDVQAYYEEEDKKADDEFYGRDWDQEEE